MLSEIAQGSTPPLRNASGRPHRAWLRFAAATLGAVVFGAGGFLVHQLAYGHTPPAPSAVPAGAGSAAPPEKLVQANAVTTFGRAGDVPAWDLGGTQCARSFLAIGKPVTESAPCDAPHGIQLFAAATPFWDKSKSVPYPGVPWLADYARRYCTEQFRVSRAAHVPGLTFAMLVPTDREWNAWNDQVSPGRQEVLCVAWQQNRSTLDKSLVAG